MGTRTTLVVASIATLSIVAAPRPVPAKVVGGMTLAEGARASAEIVIPSVPSLLETRAAEELSRYLRRTTDAEFAVVNENETTRGGIFIGRTRRGHEGHAGEADALGPEGFVIACDGATVSIIGGDDYGTLYGAYEFLERFCGVRWYAPGDLGEVVPRIPKLTVPEARITGRPAFRMRWVGRDSDWVLRTRGNAVRDPVYPPAFRVEPGIYHTQEALVPHAATYPRHPEYFALVDGNRSDDRSAKLCYGNPEVADAVAGRMAEIVRADPTIDLISFSPTDGQMWCECDLCRALDEPNTSVDQRYSRRSLIFYNRLAERLKGEFPDQEILVGAYNVYNQPPRDPDVRADPSLSVIITHYDEYCKVHPIDDPDCPANTRYRALIRAWQDRGVRRVYFYEYYMKANWLSLPWPIARNIGRDIRYFASIGASGLFTQYNPGTVWTNLREYYVAAKLLWDPSMSVDGLLDEFYRLFYGPAEVPMRRYYETLEQAMTASGRHFPGNAFENARYIFTPSVLARLEAALARAEEVCGSDTSAFAQRVGKVRTSLAYTDAVMSYFRARDSLGLWSTEDEFRRALADIEQRHGQIMEYLDDEAALDGVVAVGSARRYWHREKEDLLSRLVPERTEARRLGMVNEWLLIGPFPNDAWEGHARVYPPEREIDPSACYVGKRGEPVCWRRYRERPWDGFVDLERFFNGEEWAVAYARAWVEAERPVAGQVRLGSNDSVVLWIGGEKVHENLVERGATPDEDRIPVHLPEGRTPILLKIGQSGHRWGFYFRITDLDGNPLDGLHFSIEP